MRITVRNSYDPSPESAPDLAVFFDVFRASTTLLSLVHVGASKILSANDEETCRDYHGQGFELVSEVFAGGIDNSPSQVLAGAYQGRAVIHKSTNLTAAVFHNRGCRQALIGSFGNASKLAAYIRASGAETVDLVAAAHFIRRTEAVEDKACALLLEKLLRDAAEEPWPLETEVRAKIREKASRQPPLPAHYVNDMNLAIERDRFPYLLEARPIHDRLMEIVPL